MGIFSKIIGRYVEYQNVASVGQVLMKLTFFSHMIRASNDFFLIFFLWQAILRNLPESEMIESISIGGPGFVNVVLSNNWIAEVLSY